MKHQRLRIADYHHSPTTPYVLEGYRVNGKRKRLFFRTRAEAELELARLKIVLRKEGDAGAELGAGGRIEAVRCIERLSRFGKTLTDATDYLLEHLEREQKAKTTLTINKLISERLTKLERIGRSAVHIKDTKIHLSRFALTFGNRPAGSITSEEIEQWLEALPVGQMSYNNYRARLAALFAFGCKKELITQNPVTRIERKNVPPARTQIIAPADLQQLLDGASPELVPALAISYFAGLRTAEILRLTWDDVNLTRGYIEVPAHKAKSAQRRLVKIEGNLMDWLRPYAGLGAQKVYQDALWTFHTKVGRLYAETGIRRLSNCGRHSFASYWLAQHADSAALAGRLGHTGSTLIFSTYRELTSPEAALAYWNIRPSNVPANVVAIASQK
jgi:integrase